MSKTWRERSTHSQPNHDTRFFNHFSGFVPSSRGMDEVIDFLHAQILEQQECLILTVQASWWFSLAFLLFGSVRSRLHSLEHSNKVSQCGAGVPLF